MAELQMLNGPDEGRIIPLGSVPVVIGRSPSCDVVIPSGAVGRQHACIERRQGRYFITDLKSQNGTFVNDERLSEPTPLRENDSIRICDFRFVFLDRGPVRDEVQAAEPLFQALAEGTEEGSGRLQFQVSPGGPPEEECRRLRESLETNHVFLVRAEAIALPRQLSDGDPLALQLLGRGFHRVVILDAAAGLKAGEEQFDLERFLRDVYERMVLTFGLRASPERFHVENVSQILKDEPRSLFCFLNVQLIPAADLRRLRGFTQEAHQVLFLCCGERDLAREEAEEGPQAYDSSVTNTTVSAQTAGGLEMLDLFSRWHRSSSDLASLSQLIGNDLFHLFHDAERCFLIQTAEGSDHLMPRVVKTRRAQDESTARFSRSIVRRCLESAQAFLSDDASRDDRIQLSQSVVDFRIRSVMCAPLCRADGKAFGVIQLDTQDRRKRFTHEDLKLLCGVANQASIALENARLIEDAVKEERLKRDLQLAHDVQRTFLPKPPWPKVPGYELGAHHEAAQQVGGDYHGFIPLPEGRLAVAVGDVAGKGVAAALMMAKLSSDMWFSLLTEADPARAVAKLNELICETASQSDRFVTLALAVLDPTRHQLTLVSAGHPSPLLYRPGATTFPDAMPKEVPGVPLGIVEGFPFEACTVTLQPGDSLILFTDGVHESLDVKGNPFGMKGIEDALRAVGRAGPQAIVDAVVHAVKQHAAGRDPFDDITVVALSRIV